MLFCANRNQKSVSMNLMALLETNSRFLGIPTGVSCSPRQGQYVGSWVIRGESEAGRPPGAPMGGYQPSRGPPYPNQSAHGPNEAVKVLPV